MQVRMCDFFFEEARTRQLVKGSAYTQLPRRHGFGVGILTAGVRGLRAKPLQDTGEVCLTQENNACCGPMSNLQVCLPLHVERLEPRHIGRS